MICNSIVIPVWLLRRKEVSYGAKVLYGILLQVQGSNIRIKYVQDILGKCKQSVYIYLKELKNHKLIRSERSEGVVNNYYFLKRQDWLDDYDKFLKVN
ncbi:hypothetical protein ACFL40_04440 [candidate division KSB1 bacterium]